MVPTLSEAGFVAADRVGRLGTETVFAVSAEAAALAAHGKTIYPFHLGDVNIPTAEHIVEASLKAIRDGKTTYCPNAGIAPLWEALTADVGDAVDGETEYYSRLACSGVSTSQITEGLDKLRAFVNAGGPTGPHETPEEKRR
jgi:hypothetical protein